jgi:hypothetical protein
MGFSEQDSKEALERYDWDEERALNFLLSMWDTRYSYINEIRLSKEDLTCSLNILFMNS